MIHKTAVVDPRAEIGNDVSVGPFACIEANVRIGNGCIIGPHVSIFEHTTLGDHCRVHAGAVLGDLPQDLSFKPGGASYVRIGANCVMREGVTVHRGTKPETATVIGEGCFLMAFSHFAHNVTLGRRVIVANGSLLAGYVDVGDGAFISGNVIIHQFVQIGRLAMLGGGAAVTKDVPMFCTLRSATLNAVVGVNIVGMRRAGMTPEERADVRRAFKLLYTAGLNCSQAAAQIRASFSSGPALEFANFVERSKRGICPSGILDDDEES